MPQATIYQGVAHVPIVRYVHASPFPIPWRVTGERETISEDMAGGRTALLAGVVTGECMSPEVEPGDSVIWDFANRNPQDGEMVVVSHDGAVLVKRAYRDAAGLFVLAANDGQRLRPNGAVLEGVVVAIIKRPRRRSLPPA